MIDTLKIADTLRDGGFDEQQARAVTVAISAAVDQGDIATKRDVADAKTELRSEIALVRKELEHVRWIVYATFGGVLALFIRSFFG